MKQKFLLTSVVVLLLSLTTKAQIGKGSFTAGGSLGYTSTSQSLDSNNSKQTGFTINPAFGKAISDNVIAGIDLFFSNIQTKNSAVTTKQIQNTYGAGFFMRWYLPVVSRLYIFGQGRVGFDYSKQDVAYTLPYGGSKGTIKSWDAGVFFYPGVSFAVNKKFQLEAGFNNLFGAQYASRDEPLSSGTTKFKSFSAGLNLNNQSTFTVGFRLLINKKG